MQTRKLTDAVALLATLVILAMGSLGCGPGQDELRIGALEHFKRGNLLITANDPRGAVTEYKMAIALDDSQDAFFFNMGLAYYQLALFDQAIASYEAAIALNPGLGEAWYNLSLALDRIGETDKAFLAYERYQAINAVKSRPEPKPEPGKPVVLDQPEGQPGSHPQTK